MRRPWPALGGSATKKKRLDMVCLKMLGLNGAVHRLISYGAFMVSMGNLETECYKDGCREKGSPPSNK
jgi:hypothetical protein